MANGVLHCFSTGEIVSESSDGSKSTLHVYVCTCMYVVITMQMPEYETDDHRLGSAPEL